MEVGNKTKERTDKFKDRDDYIKEIIRTEKEEALSNQNNITNYFAPEVPKDKPIMVESFLEEENQEDSVKDLCQG